MMLQKVFLSSAPDMALPALPFPFFRPIPPGYSRLALVSERCQGFEFDEGHRLYFGGLDPAEQNHILKPAPRRLSLV